MMADRQVHVAGVHLYDEESGEYNVAPVRRRLGGRALTLVNLAVWEQGLVVAAGNPKKIRAIGDLARKGVRTGGARERHRLAGAASPPGRRGGSAAQGGGAGGRRARAHGGGPDRGRRGADAGIATRAARRGHGLDFIPLAEARFDLVMPRETADDVRLQRLLDVLGSQRFKRDLGGLAGYGTARTGHVVAEVAEVAA
jgi:putative molybdopterin biosynthesis protein